MKKAPLDRLSESDFEEIAGHFRALSEVSRLKIVAALQRGERSVGEIVEATNLSQPNVSKHLAILMARRLIAKRRIGTSAIYRIADDSLKELCSVVCRGR